MDGYEATREIRQMLSAVPERKRVAIVIASANKLDESGEEWASAGANAAICKPFGKADIEKILERFCSN
jgi:CheY-like chemotaxis protein